MCGMSPDIMREQISYSCPACISVRFVHQPPGTKQTGITVTIRNAVVVAALWAGSACAISSLAAVPEFETTKVESTPDFCQYDKRAGFAGNGRSYCGPVSVSNSLMQLAGDGFSRLLPEGSSSDRYRTQVNLVKELASHMKTKDGVGTSMPNVVAGAKQYVESRGYKVVRTEFQGWRSAPASGALSRTSAHPDLEAIKAAVADRTTAVWINVGWYAKGEKPNEWKRVGGHWVTVVGYGLDADGNKKPNTLILANPSGTNAQSTTRPSEPTTTHPVLSHGVVECEPLTEGQLLGSVKGLPANAKGYYVLRGAGLPLRAGRDAAILDAVVFFKISP